jgi:ketosteroid isomerase-like protein
VGESADRRQVADALFVAINARDLDALAELTDPAIEFESALMAIDGDVYRGVEGMARYFETIHQVFEDPVVELVEFHDTPEASATLIRFTATARGSGVPVDTHNGQVWTWRKGRLARVVTFRDPSGARAAIGLAE